MMLTRRRCRHEGRHMAKITEQLGQIGLSEFDVFGRWTEAPVGALLQILLDDGTQAIGWRCNYDTTACLLIVASERDGEIGHLLVDVTGSRVGPALNVAEVLELAVESAIEAK